LFFKAVRECEKHFPTALFLIQFYCLRTSGTFGFAPTLKANASQNQKSHFFAYAQKEETTNQNFF